MRHSSEYQDFILQPNLAVDPTGPAGKLVPYLIEVWEFFTSCSLLWKRFRDGTATRVRHIFRGWTGRVGAGVKLFLTSVIIAPEGRFGHEPFSGHCQPWLRVPG